MVSARVVDTNVLIVSSAADDGSPFRPGATPVQEGALRKQVLDWLTAFEQDTQRYAVLDWDWHICSEYQNKLTEQDYGWMALMLKKDRNEVVWIGLEMDADGHAILPATLAPDVTDLADRKIVAAVLAGQAEGVECKLTNACDTDWLDCADALTVHGVEVEHLIEGWLRIKWASMRGQA
jgi:hypothetical protein